MAAAYVSPADSNALVVGAGGLGCPASLALARAGVRRLTLADPDRVDETNLHRQLWHRASDVGRPKVESAADRLRAAFPGLTVATLPEAVGAANALELFRRHDLVIDATDGDAIKFLLSDAAVLTQVPLVYGGALRMKGQAMRIARGGPCLRCLFEGPPPPGSAPTCAEAGVLGSLAGAVGALQAVLALAPRPEVSGEERLLVLDGTDFSLRAVPVRRAPDCRACSPKARARLKLEDPQGASCPR
ncbi:MAG: HesA/MoeB/ThiF family protein [Myxococcaceae bacterium]